MKNILTALFLGVILSLQAFAQNEMSKDKMMQDKVVSPQDAAKTALNVGGQMPEFTLSDATGKSVTSNELLKQGNLVVVFYRGAWCPFCNKYLHKLQENLSEIKAGGGNLVAISVENPDTSMTVSSKNELTFTVLSDPKFSVAKKFGIVYELPKETNEKYKGYGIDLVKNNGTEKPELPLSATYVVDSKGKIIYAWLEPDYTKRAEPADILKVLAEQKASMKPAMKEEMTKPMTKAEKKKAEKMKKAEMKKAATKSN
jgi:peroxiredoxin